MKKLLSIITALTVAASATSSLVSCKVITNEFKIEVPEFEQSLKYEFKDGQYKPKESYKNTEADVKKALDGITGNFASSLVADMINSLFFNANLSVTQNSKNIWQYLFRTDKEGVYADGQYRTAGLNSKQQDKINDYYSNVSKIASLLGLMQYSEWSNSQSTNVEEIKVAEAKKPITLSEETIKLVNESKMFESSNNQGITNVKIKSTPKLYEGKIGLAKKTTEGIEKSEEANNEPIKIDSYVSSYISKETNYSEKTAKETDPNDPTKGYGEYIAGTNLAVDFFSQLLISELQGSPEVPIQVKKVKEQSDISKENVKKQGLILNSENVAEKSKQPEFEYTEDEKGNKTPYAYGYSLVSLEPINLELTYNDNLDLKTGKPKPGNQNYIIDLTIEGLSAAFKPILGFTSYKNEKDEVVKDKSGIPYVGWRFMGYQFNSKNIIGYNEDGTQYTEKPNKKMAATNKKFNDFNISKFEFKKA
ncbi:hypothetical protein MENTO_v1c00870 [Mesoplasma entomophilum]|uniref:Lipoprotein n=1 Tax=Mesoplasma entomophilum TaxID=2149 RepID=A0A3S5XYD4_9MOLU|nr:hypothetical protein [Mesoplasma entomophilum]ATQ35248.1 hypothetical protein CS528_00435 [Mesoplasma entomophilum]ATZ19196.1 hypothetical protein MENTO_v1c00870 [Mesoplasma entomophilum]